MFSRINTYLKEMYPVIPRMFVALIIFFALDLLAVLVYDVNFKKFGMPEITGIITVFGFLLFLRIADEFKDYETDRRLFPERALPSGRVHKKDLKIVLAIDLSVIIIMNLVFQSKFTLYFFAFLMFYGFLMSQWFFIKKYIQPNLLLALITHNPVQLILNYYISSIICSQYDLKINTLAMLCINLILCMPAAEWEIGRKLRKPEDETEYVTYSKIFGYKKAVLIFLLIATLELCVTLYIASHLVSIVFVIILPLFYIIFWICCIRFMKNPSFKFSKLSEAYIYTVQSTLIIMSLSSLYLR